MTSDYKPHVNQKKMHNSKAKEVLVIASIRSGKTYSLIRDVFVKAWKYKGNKNFGILVCCPNYKMLTTIIEKEFMKEFSDYIKYFNQSLHNCILKNGSKIYFRSLEVVDTAVRGLNVHMAYVDEVQLISEYDLGVIRGRLVLTNGQLKMFGTPNGKKSFIYDEFILNKRNDFQFIKYKITDNPEITEEAVKFLKDRYSDKMFKQEIEGEWIDENEQNIYYNFSDENIVDNNKIQNKEFFIGIDYNVGINALVVLQKDDKGKILVVDEKVGLATLNDVALYIKQNYPQAIIVDDAASGNARSVQTGITTRAMLQQLGVRNIIERTWNTEKEVRYNIVNSWFLNANNKRNLFIMNNCKNLIKSLRMYDGKNEQYSHITDALGYILQYLSNNEIQKDVSEKKYSRIDFIKQYSKGF